MTLRNALLRPAFAGLAIFAGLLLSAGAPATPEADDMTAAQQLFMVKQLLPDAAHVGLVWSTKIPDANQKMDLLKRTAANLGVTLYLASVEDLKDVGPEVRRIVRDYNLDAVLITHNDGLVDQGAAKQFIITHALQNRLPLFAPSTDWVEAGAAVAFHRVEKDVHLAVNEQAARATKLAVPASFADKTAYLSSN